MADKKISQLPSVTTPSDGDLLILVSGAETKKITRRDFLKNIKVIIDPAASGGTATGNMIVLTSTGSQAVGDLVMINSSGKAKIAKADSFTNALAVLIAATAVSGEAQNTYLLPGGTVKLAVSPSWTTGHVVYLSTAGTSGNTLTQTIPVGSGNIVMIIGVALSEDTLLFEPFTTVEHI